MTVFSLAAMGQSNLKGDYIGEKKNGVPHGKGKMVWFDGKEYDGEWKNGKRHGKGTMIYRDGREFVGDWVNDEEVKGREIDADGKGL